MDEPKIQNSWISVRDHSRVFGELVFVYPVISRRSRGLSIGINLNPDKRCNFDCVYCEVDRKTPGRASAVDLKQLHQELVWLIRYAQSGELGKLPKFAETAELTQKIRDLAFSGDGEPTMIPNFRECVEVAVNAKNETALRSTQLVLITDSAGLDKLNVQQGLELMDANQGEIWAKLDAGTESYYKTVNRSAIRFDRILNNLLITSLKRPIVIQSLFLKIHGQAISPAELNAYCGRLNDLVRQGGRIKEVHAYTIARPTPETWATKLQPDELERIAHTIGASTGLRVLRYD